MTAVWLGGYAEWSYDGECTNASARECSNSCKMESARSRRRREMGDVAVCLRGLNHARASSTVGGVVWRAVTRGYYPVETIVELYIKATLGGTTAMFMYLQGSMS